MKQHIPVFEPEITSDEINAVVDALKKGEISGSFGDYLPKFEQSFAKYVGCEYGIAVNSGTSALHLAIAAAEIGNGDEVLVSSLTNIATALCVAHQGAIPIPVDSEAETWNLDLSLLETLITPRTKAIIPVHLYGHPVDMDALMKIANKHNLLVIEDCAESHGATIRGKMSGSFGDMNCFSFYANKIITTGEGGMITTNNKKWAEKLRLLRNLAFTQPRFKHDLLGFNFRMTGFQAAIGYVQTQKIEKVVERKRVMAHTYNSYLKKITGLQLPAEKSWARNVYWMYGIVVEPTFGKTRDQLMSALSAKGIETRTFFFPMNIQPCLLNVKGFPRMNNPVAERLWETGLYLPSSPSLTEKVISHICSTIDSIRMTTL